MNWHGHEIAAALGSQLVAAPENLAWEASGVSIDSRTLRQNEIFVALKGPNFNGGDFLPQVADKLAAAAIAESAPPEVARKIPVFQVRSGHLGLAALAEYARDTGNASRIAVTGSNGKTSMRKLVSLALGGAGSVHASIRSYNNKVGVSLTLAQMKRGAKFAVLEVGTNHPGEIRELAELVKPRLAVLTSVGSAHIGHFNSRNDLAAEKAALIAQLDSEGVAVVHESARELGAVAAAAENAGVKIHSYGRGENTDAKLISVTPETPTESQPLPNSVTVTADVTGQSVRFQLRTPAPHHAELAVGALLVAKLLGADTDTAAQDLREYQPPDGRGNIIRVRGAWVVDDSYNANPESVAAALSLVGGARLAPGAERVAVLADMGELGAQSEELHLGLVPHILNAKITRLFLVGREIQPVAKSLSRNRDIKVRWAESLNSLNLSPADIARDHNLILVKGSRAAKLDAFVASLVNTAADT
ncbi:MAG: UDP-N-acetylmuramoyl-tripeptide--D-alanyl-D-alanine ligase [Alphaproteobacteria bacterium]|nr:UDP-N-acetylmuramoyl-tripeptide--D-alanyl-D-alanine ligase [Alphaproteobacteria bacterium]